MKQPAASRGQAGFTLLEMLVVLALLGLLMVLLTQTISFAMIARARVVSAIVDEREFFRFNRLMELELGRAYPGWAAQRAGNAVDFAGNSNSITFIAPALEGQGPGFARYQIDCLPSAHGQQIHLRSVSDAESSRQTLEADFAIGLSALTIRYFGPPHDGGAAMWQTDWNMRTRLPDLIAIDVTFPKGDRRSWPEIIIRPEIGGDVTCQIDAATHDCAGR